MASYIAALGPVVEKVGLQLLLEPNTSGMLFRAASTSFGVILPAYQTYKAIENKTDNQRDEQWLTYWIIYAALSLVENTTDPVVSKIPYYWHAKVALLLWLQLPQTQGAKHLYTNYFKPTIQRFEPKIDVCIDKVGSVMMTLYSIYKVPLDQITALGAFGIAQLVAFVKWFADPNSGPGSTGKGSTGSEATNRRPPSQFISR